VRDNGVVLDVALRDGSTVRIRPVTATDRDGILSFLERLSPESRRLRFFSGAVNLERAADAASVSDDDQYAVVAVRGFGEDRDGFGDEVVAHALYGRRDGADRAEVAFAVADSLQGQGIATVLLGHLADVAAEHGVEFFEAEVLPENHRMADVFRESGFDVRTRSEPGTVVIEFPASLSPRARERFDERERAATVAALRRFLHPRSVAVVGASRSIQGPGGAVFHNLLAGGFNGPVFPVNAAADTVQSVHAYRSIEDLPEAPDVAVVAVPADAALDVARACAGRGTQALVMLSAGFSETGKEGAKRERALLDVCRSAGMRLIGPNCLGIVNTAPDVRLNASFAPGMPPRGRIGFMSQSGALGIAVIQHARSLGIGLSSFVSAGNKADISGNDLLRYWAADDDTDVILLYLESFGNPRKFGRIVPEVARRKPVLAVKSGRSAAGAKATTSHTGALLAASDVTVEALFRQAGVIRTDTLAELFDVAKLLTAQPAPRGRRVAVVTNAGGPAILATDASAARGLELPELPKRVRDELREFLPPAAAIANPVDMIATATPEDYARTIAAIGRAGVVDALIAIFVPLQIAAEDVAVAVAESVAALEGSIPVLAVFMSGNAPPAPLASVPAYAYPEQAAAALAHAVRYGEWCNRAPGATPVFDDVDRDEVAALIATALAEGRDWLTAPEALELLGAWGIPLAPWTVARSARAAGRAARELEGQVALKAVAPRLLHKSEAGAVVTGLEGARAVERAAREMAARVRAAGHEPDGFVVQRMAEEGPEILIGVVNDPLFGPLLACGAGGTAAEVLRDVEVRLTPLADRDAAEMIRALRSFPLLAGFRGAPVADVGALEQVVLRVSAMVETHEEIAELDLNPVIVSPDGAVAVDARIRLEAPPRRQPFLSID
jgi:acetate---CoA ligase (ADP-forming)